MEPKVLIFAFIVGTIVSTVSAATAIGLEPKKPAHLAHKQGCFISQIQDVIPYGTTITPIGNCLRIGCTEGWIDYASCGVVGTHDPKCFITDTDLSKPYPRCCPDVKCESDNNIL